MGALARWAAVESAGGSPAATATPRAGETPARMDVVAGGPPALPEPVVVGNLALAVETAPSVAVAPRVPDPVPAVRAVGEVDVWRDVPAAGRALAVERLRFLQEVQRLAVQGRSIKDAVGLIAANAGRYPELATAGHGGRPALTVRNYNTWIRRARDAGWQHRDGAAGLARVAPALADRYAAGPRERDGDPAAWQLLARLYEHPHAPALRPAYEQMAREYRRLHPVARVGDLPSLSQVYYWYRHRADQAALVLARAGAEDARNLVAPYVARDWSGVAVGECWIGDHHQFDAWVRVPAPGGGWQAARPWLTGWLDARSHYFVGVRLGAGESPNHLWILEALVLGLRAAGGVPPRVLYVDNGKDYQKRGFVEPVLAGSATRSAWPATTSTVDGAAGHAERVALPEGHSIARELGCQVLTALPYNAQAKVIERRFRDVAGEFSRCCPAYWGSNPQTRPAASEVVQAEQVETLPSLQQFCQAFAQWLQTAYHARGSESRITGGRPPAELWAARPALRPALDERSLGLACLLPVGTRQVGRGYSVTLKHPYLPHPSGLHEYRCEQLREWYGREVMVKINAWRSDSVWCFTTAGKLLCEASHPVMVAALAADRDVLAAELAATRAPLRELRETWAANVGLPARGVAAALPVPGVTAGLLPAATVGETRAAQRERLAGARAEPALGAPNVAASAADVRLLDELVHRGSAGGTAAGTVDSDGGRDARAPGVVDAREGAREASGESDEALLARLLAADQAQARNEVR